jgi:hypothetical protein
VNLVRPNRNLNGIGRRLDNWTFPEYTSRTFWWSTRDECQVKTTIIGFCGKIYPVLRLIKKGSLLDEVMCHSIDDVDKFVKENFKQKQIDGYYSNKSAWKLKTNQRIGVSHKEMRKFFDKFLDHGCPVFVAHHLPTWHQHSTIAYHGRRGERIEGSEILKRTSFPERELLKTYDFYRIFDPYTAFQELSMYFGGVLGTANPYVPEVSDKDLRDAKGFDDWSFKKEPSKKK